MGEFVVFIFYVVFFTVIFKSVKKSAGEGKKQSSSTKKNSSRKMTTAGKTRKNAKPAASARPNVPTAKPVDKPVMDRYEEEYHQPTDSYGYSFGEDKHKDKRVVALRLMEGDPVPEGYVGITCHYCGAVNLVTQGCHNYHSCYFCREPID
jgi:hypothetical protein